MEITKIISDDYTIPSYTCFTGEQAEQTPQNASALVVMVQKYMS